MSVDPPSSFILIVTCSQLQKFDKYIFETRNISLKPNEMVLDGKYYLFFTINLRQCQVGEVFIAELLMLYNL